MNVDLVISCTVMCNPFDTRREATDNLFVKDTNLECGGIIPVYADDTRVLSIWTEAFKEVGAIWRVHVLFMKIGEINISEGVIPGKIHSQSLQRYR